MLETSAAVAFLPSLDLDRSEHFFRTLLGLELVNRSPLAVVLMAGTTELRVTKVDDLRPQPFTVFGWRVNDARAIARSLHDQGILTVRYDGMAQDDDGIWTSPGGELIAWFHDPDQNLLSITQLSDGT